MTSQEPRSPYSVDSDSLDTEVIVVSSPASVFVDSTGRRRRLLRRLSYVFGALCMVYGGLVSVSLAGGPVSSSAVLPLPDLRDDPEEAAGPRPAPVPAPSVSARPVEVYVGEVPPRRRTTADVTRIGTPRPPAVSSRVSAKPTPSTTPTSAKPVESATVPVSPAPTPTIPVPVPTTKPPPPPVPAPPAPPVTLDKPVAAPAPPSVESSAEPADEPEAPETTDPAEPPEPPEPPEPSVAAEQAA